MSHSNPTFALAVTELIYYTPALFPTLYCVYAHRHTGLSGYLFLTIFLTLQIVGSAMTASAGLHGTPTTTAAIITGVGLSPLLLAMSGLLHQAAKFTGLTATSSQKKKAWIPVIIYHVHVLTAIALYAVGASDGAKPDEKSNGHVLADVGVIMLLLAWVALVAAMLFIMQKARGSFPKAMLVGLGAALVFLGVRIVYASVATLSQAQELNPITGKVAFKVVFEFLPAALIVAVLITLGVVTQHLRPAEPANLKQNVGTSV